MLLLSFVLALILLMLLARPVSAEVSEPSPLILSRDHYPESGLTGDGLIKAINSFSGFYTVSTVNPDSSPNVAFFIFSAFEHEDKLYLRLNLDENQSKHNILSTKLGVAMYAVTPGIKPGDKPFAVSGARMRFRLVEDKDLIIEMSNGRNSPSLFVEVLQVRPLG